MSDHLQHVANVFPLRGPAEGPLALVQVEIEAPRGVSINNRALLGELAFQAGRRLRTAVAPNQGALLALPSATPWPAELQHPLGLFRVGAVRELTVSWQEAKLRKPLLILVAHFLRRALVYRKDGALWYRQGGYFSHALAPIDDRGFRCRGMAMQALFSEAGTLLLALDSTLCPLGQALSMVAPAARARYLEENPYASAEQGAPVRARNFVLRQEDGRLRRVYLAHPLTEPGDPEDRVRVRAGKHGAGRAEALAALYPVLAPGEINTVLGQRWRGGHGSMPADRQRHVEEFLRQHLLPLANEGHELLRGLRQRGTADLPLPAVRGGQPAQRPPRGPAPPPPTDSDAIVGLPWPTICVGAAGVAVSLSGSPVEHRAQALSRHGLRRVPTGWHTLEVAALKGQRSLAEQIVAECQSVLRAWRCPELAVRLAAVEREPGLSGVAALAEHYRQQVVRPSLLLVCKDPREAKPGEAGDPVYQAIHRELGENFALPVKISLQPGRDLRSYVINLLGSLLARGGACLWGLAPKVLFHDLCIGVDVGGRDRGGSRGEDRVLAVAMAKGEAPHFWFYREAPQVTGETLGEELLWAIVKGAHDAIGGHSRGHWLYLRDGGISKAEREALEGVARRARAEGLLPDDRAFTAVEVRKQHALRVFSAPGPTWQQPEPGRLWRLPGYEAVLSVTGDGFDLHGSADPLHLVAHTILGTADGRETRTRALSDLWPLSHLNYSAPRLVSKLPIVLHAAQRLGDDLARGLSPRHLPF